MNRVVAIGLLGYWIISPEKRLLKADNLLFVSPEDCAQVSRRAINDEAVWAYKRATEKAAFSGASPGVQSMFAGATADLIKRAINRETETLMKAGRASRLWAGTRVKVLDRTTDSEGMSLCRVKVLSGTESGAVGYVMTDSFE